jgi:hypothetical protein
VVVYASVDGGRSFAPRTAPGGVGPCTSHADIAVASDAALVASVAYECTRWGTGPSHNQTAVFRSVTAGRTWTAVGLVTGWRQQPGCLVALADGGLALVFSGPRRARAALVLRTTAHPLYQIH